MRNKLGCIENLYDKILNSGFLRKKIMWMHMQHFSYSRLFSGILNDLFNLPNTLDDNERHKKYLRIT